MLLRVTLSAVARGILVAVLLSYTSLAAEMRPGVPEAFAQLTTAIEMRLKPRFAGETFTWSDEFPTMKQQVQSGSIVAQPAQGNGTISLKGALVQDWRATVFVPKTNLKQVLAIVQDYDHHGDIYKPDISSARIKSRQEDRFHVFMRFVKSKFMLTDVLNTEHDIEYVHLDPKRVYSRGLSTRINEVEAPGQASEHELPAGKDRGFLWGMNSYWFFEERDGGVYVSCESVTLTRDIPLGMGTLFAPIIRDLPAEALKRGLEQTRKAILSRH